MLSGIIENQEHLTVANSAAVATQWQPSDRCSSGSERSRMALISVPCVHGIRLPPSFSSLRRSLSREPKAGRAREKARVCSRLADGGTVAGLVLALGSSCTPARMGFFFDLPGVAVYLFFLFEFMEVSHFGPWFANDRFCGATAAVHQRSLGGTAKR
ncbi:hypothetical protein HPP92_028883 [Vanilla planifolia]|uniref:Uncharacterized protein n=1 Tax=Vanilla planifolia TaxID=51239 RepID=A0A835U3E3_VANPL|nr:hypothetical protein HPP92_028883 [Vanilla planifolia]KAG0446344.1 hypothetical protein HPP92_028872 [Vanilla planifolia]